MSIHNLIKPKKGLERIGYCRGLSNIGSNTIRFTRDSTIVF